MCTCLGGDVLADVCIRALVARDTAERLRRGLFRSASAWLAFLFIKPPPQNRQKKFFFENPITLTLQYLSKTLFVGSRGFYTNRGYPLCDVANTELCSNLIMNGQLRCA